jgi:ubiquinone/menaquinone biosynthesis C-methylase UbiE
MKFYSLSLNEGFFRKISYDLILDRLEKLRDKFSTHETILDLGCGERGSLGKLLEAKKRCKVVFLDNDRENIMKINARFKVCASALSIPFDNDTFDHVLCMDVIEHLCQTEREKMLKEISRVMKKGGHLFLTASQFSSSSKSVCLFFKPLFKMLRINYPQWFLEHERYEPPTLATLTNYLSRTDFKTLFRKRYQGVLSVFFIGIFYTVGLPLQQLNNMIYVFLKFLDIPPRCSFLIEAIKV